MAGDGDERRGLGPIDPTRVTRRQFLQLAGAASVLAAAPSGLTAAQARSIEPELVFTRVLRRSSDLLNLRFRFYDLALDTTTGTARLVHTRSGTPGIIVAEFEPQHLLEEVFPEKQGVPDPPVDSRLAGPSRLAFRVPAGLPSVDFKPDVLLRWARFQHFVVPAAAEQAKIDRPLRAPEPWETAIELPWWLLLSPHENGAWAHALDPVAFNQRTELWHTRYAVRKFVGNGYVADEKDAANRTIRAVWTRDPGFAQYMANPCAQPAPTREPLKATPFASLPAPGDRYDIVRATSDYKTIPNYVPTPASVERLMLTSLGGWVNLRGAWDIPPHPGGELDQCTVNSTVPIETWIQRGTMGRDSYVRVERRGYLFPMGFRAAIVSVAERKFVASPTKGVGAYLRFREFIVIRRPVKGYPAIGQRQEGRLAPLREVRCATLVTPDIERAPFGQPPEPTSDVFLPTVDGKPFEFPLVAVDHAGRSFEFTAPLAFVSVNKGWATANVRSYYNATLPEEDPIRRRPLFGQRVAFAPESAAGDTAHPVGHLILGVDNRTAEVTVETLMDADQPDFYPRLSGADIRLEAIDLVRAGDFGFVRVTYDNHYRQFGFTTPGQNIGGVYLTVAAKPSLSFDDVTLRTGGVATPNIEITALTRDKGPIGGGLANAYAGTFDPATFFSGAQLLGAVPLDEIVRDTALSTAPTVQTVMPPGKQITRLEWRTTNLGRDTKGLFAAEPGTGLDLVATYTTELTNPPRTSSHIHGELRNFAINLVGDGSSHFFTIHFKRFQYVARDNLKPEVRVDIGAIDFDGHLKFVRPFAHYLSTIGKGFSVDVTPHGDVEAGLSVAIPTIGIGVFSLQNVAMATKLTLPANGDPMLVAFALSSRENPFLVTVSMFGGGGFFGIVVSPKQVVLLEAALEFGGAVALNLGVASGSVQVMGGVHYELAATGAALTGYVRITGSLEVLGLVTVSCNLNLGLTYHEATDKCVGQATFHAEIEVGFFSASVSKVVERKFGGESDPTFDQLMSESAWQSYCDAFGELPL